MQVTKRDGRIMEFNKERIVDAIVKAMMQTSSGVDIDLANKIAISIEKGLENKDQVTVYEIQDLVEKKLMGSSRKEVATAYITYRYNRDVARKSKTREVFLDIISAKSNLNSNKNIKPLINTPAIIMTKFAAEVAKPYVDNFLLTKEARVAEREGYILINNKEYYLTKSLNSFNLSLENVNEKEYENIEAILNFIYSTINELKDELDGSISIPAFDYYLAPYIRKTFNEELEKIAEDLNIEINCNNDLEYIYCLVKDLPQEKRIIQLAINRTIKRVECSLKIFIKNIVSLQKEKRINFCFINLGTDTSNEGRCVISKFIKVIQEEFPYDKEFLPKIIWKKKKGVNYLSQDKNFDLFEMLVNLTKEQYSVSYLNLDMPLNYNEKWKDSNLKRWYYECAILDSSRVFEDVCGKDTSIGRGVLSSIGIDLPKIAIESFLSIRKDLNLDIEISEKLSEKFKVELKKKFMDELEKYTKIVLQQLVERFKFQASATKLHFPSLMSGLWMESDSLNSDETIENVIKHGTLNIGIVGLSECLIVLNDKHHGEAEEAMKLGIEIINEINNLLDEFSDKYKLNFALSSQEDIEGKFIEKDRVTYGIIDRVTDSEFYTSGTDIPKNYEITYEDKAKIESEFHKIFKGGNKFVIEKEKTQEINEVIKLMDKYNLGCICFE